MVKGDDMTAEKVSMIYQIQLKVLVTPNLFLNILLPFLWNLLWKQNKIPEYTLYPKNSLLVAYL